MTYNIDAERFPSLQERLASGELKHLTNIQLPDSDEPTLSDITYFANETYVGDLRQWLGDEAVIEDCPLGEDGMFNYDDPRTGIYVDSKRWDELTSR